MALPNEPNAHNANRAPTIPIKSAFASDPDMLELIQEFASEMPVRARELISLYERADRQNLLRMAHQLKGASAGYGFESLGRVAATLEASLRQESNALESLRSQLDELVSMCNRVSP